MLEIDGAHGEGGGRLVRTAVALAAVTGTAIRLHDVRARRDRPGLAPQHLTAMGLISQVLPVRFAVAEAGGLRRVRVHST
jgi:RNA 3'-terminal phosphate cyclase